MAAANAPALALGFDAGSVALKVVVTDLAGNLLEQSYTRTQGRPVETAVTVLGEIISRYGARAFDLIAGTGSAGRLLCDLLNVPFVNEVICQATAVKHLHPEVRTLIEMGGQDSKLIFLPEGPANGRPMVDFAMNTNCAAGTGSFLDQQASRLGIKIEEEFGRLALQSKNPPRVAGRCSVFAKSDMIHLQQQAAPVHDIVAGLCLGLARNLKGNLGRGMEMTKPIAFTGGVAANQGVVRAMEEVFELASGELVIPACHANTGALGAVLVSLKERGGRGEGYGRPGAEGFEVTPLSIYLEQSRDIGHRIDGLSQPSDGYPDCTIPTRAELEERAKNGLIDAWLGLDVGSISTKVAVIDKDNRVLAKCYLMTAGRPLEAVRRVLKEIGRQCGGLVKIRGAGTTGSGRYLTGDFIGADMVINEITAQATAAAVIDPEVDTIFEIGGQDSKYIALDRGVVVDFEMNHACAAGTGSFIEEQSERLGIDIRKDFHDHAFSSDKPIRLGERCTVFMESDLLNYQQQGAVTKDLVAGLCFSIVSNYINRVVGHRRIGKRIFFQGGTAFNKGVVAAFEKYTGRRITVPPHHEVTGAMGTAFLARKHQEKLGNAQSNFGGFDLADVQYSIRSFECKHCSNLCEINEVSIPGRDTLYYGSRCDRYNLKKDKKDEQAIPNLFIERQRMLISHAKLKREKKPDRPTMGIPLALSNYQLLPFWSVMLGELGFNVVISGASTQEVIHSGVEAVLSTPCFPVKVAHGHVLALLEKGVDYVWMPSVIGMKHDYQENEHNQLCPYVTAIPYQVAPAIEGKGKEAKMLRPPVRLTGGPKGVYKALKGLCGELKISAGQLKSAVEKAWAAQDAFEEACRARGREILNSLDGSRRALVIVSRPYNGCDTGVCLDLPEKLRKLGVLPIPMDFLDLRDTGPTGDRVFKNMYWKYGQRIMRAGAIVRQNPRLHAIYLSNFSCGPDSFLISYFKRMMAPKPSLILEVDEHSADAGIVTRLEAFLESLNNADASQVGQRQPLYPIRHEHGHKRKLFIPWMGDEAYPLAAAFRGCGQPAEVIPMADQHSVELGRRYCTGKECLPCIITTGDMIRVTQRPDFDAEHSAFFMPGGSGPCRFGQYNTLQKLILNELGLGQVPVVAPSQDKEFYDDWNRMFEVDPMRIGWCGIVATDMLQRALLALRPYEKTPGACDQVYEKWLKAVCDVCEKRPVDDDFLPVLESAAAEFAKVEVDRSHRRPRIGIVGEIYVRRHSFANNDLVRMLEKLGAEATPAGFPEWIFYTNWVRKEESKREWSLRQWLGNALKDHVQHKIQKKYGRCFERLLGHSYTHEAPVEEILDLAAPYVDRSFEGEAVLSVGKIVEFHHSGCHGVINVMPFTCMPSTIVGGLMKKLSNDLGQLPTLSISYDGQADPMLQTRLEAFIYQARMFQAKATGGPLPHLPRPVVQAQVFMSDLPAGGCAGCAQKCGPAMTPIDLDEEAVGSNEGR